MDKLRNGALKGAIIGDIVGSIFEHNNIKSKLFPFFGPGCRFTDDTVCTVAVASVFTDGWDEVKDGGDYIEHLYLPLRNRLLNYGQAYPHAGYGRGYKNWLREPDPRPYASAGNGAPMRCSAAGCVTDDPREAMGLGVFTCMPTHNHPGSAVAAGLAAELICLARNGASMEKLREEAEEYYAIPKLDELRPHYHFHVSSRGTMPAALAAFFESRSFEDAVRNAVSLGGDSDTLAAITGSLAEAFWGVPDEIWESAKNYLDAGLLEEVERFYRKFG